MTVPSTQQARLQIPNWPHYDQDERDAAARVLESGAVNYWTGNEGKAFEREFAAYVGSRHAVAVSNGTVALELALRGLGIGSGDEVIVPSRTFVATAGAVQLVGAQPIFADVESASGNIDPESVRALVSSRTRAIIPVHTSGWPCDMDALQEISKEHDLRLVEDCAQSHGARYKGRAVGTLGDVAAFSFCQDKIMSTGGEGGMVVTNDDDVWDHVWSFKDHGKSHHEVHRQDHPPGFRWLHTRLGTNGRMTEIQAAIGRVQLQKLDGWVKRRRENGRTMGAALADLATVEVPVPGADIQHAYYRFDARIRSPPPKGARPRDEIMDALAGRGLPAHSGSCSEIYLETSFQRTGLGPATRLPMARRWSETSLMFPVHHRIPIETSAALGDAVAEVIQEIQA